MKRTAAVSVIGLAAALLLAAGHAGAQDAERGKAVYEEQKCKLCHSVAGEGNKKGALDDVGGRLGAEEIEAWHRNPKEMTEKSGSTRKPAMKAYGEDKLSEEDLDALVAYLLTLKG
jgi:mono/diheme cytochrome c family protein